MVAGDSMSVCGIRCPGPRQPHSRTATLKLLAYRRGLDCALKTLIRGLLILINGRPHSRSKQCWKAN